MKKNVSGDNVYYSISWSRVFEYEKYSASRIVPELPGIIRLMHKKNNRYVNQLFYACWRDGCREGLKKLMDDLIDKHNDIREKLLQDDLYFCYTIIDTNPRDMQDIMYWLISEYKPLLNDAGNFDDSKRYRDISIKEEDPPGHP
ncbi:MAG: hypothetical protein EOM23_04005 [Candidatus Moranbacteria bacterium]|nr:hypothetical protein [Candidatus Moranbacteria bacterium]